MIFRLFTKTKSPPLTAFCMQFSSFEKLFKVANGVLTDRSPGPDKRASMLALLIMATAGQFVGPIELNEKPYKEVRQYLRDTNLDVITAETIIWITFLISQLWRADQQNDREMFKRVGDITVSTAGSLAIKRIKSETGFDFMLRAIESLRFYHQSVKDGEITEAFVSVLFRSVGCRSLAEPLKSITISPLDLVWSRFCIIVSDFCSTIPPASYETFKNILKERPDLFSYHDDNFGG